MANPVTGYNYREHDPFKYTTQGLFKLTSEEMWLAWY